MGPTIRIVAAALALAFVSMPFAQARDISNDGVTYEEIAAWLKEKGMPATIQKDARGNQIVSTSVNGVKFGVYFFDCQNGKCGSVQFAAGFQRNNKTVLQRVNEWNRTKRWGRAYLDDSNGIWVEMDNDLTPGGTYEILDDELATWKKVVEGFKSFFDL